MVRPPRRVPYGSAALVPEGRTRVARKHGGWPSKSRTKPTFATLPAASGPDEADPFVVPQPSRSARTPSIGCDPRRARERFTSSSNLPPGDDEARVGAEARTLHSVASTAARPKDRLVPVACSAARRVIQDTNDLPRRIQEEIEPFFLNVTFFEPQDAVILGWAGPKEAWKQARSSALRRLRRK